MLRLLLLLVLSIVLLPDVGHSKESQLISVGAVYALTPAPNYHLLLSDSDMWKLTDGKRAQTHFWTSRAATVGWQDSGQIAISLTLDSEVPIGQLCLRMARGEGAGVAFPISALAFVSPDHQRYRFVGDLMADVVAKHGGYRVDQFCADGGGARTKYVELLIQPNGSYFFTDEVSIYRSEAPSPDLSFPIPVTQLGEAGRAAQASLIERQALSAMLGDSARLLRASDGDDQILSLMDLVLKNGSIQPVGDQQKLLADVFQLNAAIGRRQHSDPLLIWNADPWAPFSQIETVPPDRTERASCLAFIGGHCSVAIALEPLTSDATDVTVSLIHGSVGESVEMARVLPIIAGPGPRYVFDPIEPLKNSRMELTVGQASMLWLTVSGNRANVGSNNVTIKFTSMKTRQVLGTFVISVQVWPIEPPAQTYFWGNAWAYSNWTMLRGKTEQVKSDLRSHHVNVRVLHPDELPWPKTNDEVSLDFRDLDRVLRPVEPQQRYLLYLGFNNKRYRELERQLTFNDPQWERALTGWFDQVTRHLRKIGLSNDQFAFYPFDEPQSAEDMALLARVVELGRAAAPGAKFYSTIGDPTLPILGSLIATVDILQIADRPGVSDAIAAAQAVGREVWIYDTPAKQADILRTYRSQALRATYLGAEGVGFWAYGDANGDGSVWNDFDGRRIDFSVVYDRGPNLLSSRRWEAWREGMEDAALLRLAMTMEGQSASLLLSNYSIDDLREGLSTMRVMELRKLALEVIGRGGAPVQ